MKSTIQLIITLIGSFIAYLIGGFTASLNALLILMVLDTILGFTNALVFKRSKKTKDGKASSNAGIIGITKKLLMIAVIIIAHQMDIILGINIIREGTIIGYAAMEVFSLLENLAFMGVPIPKVIRDGMEIMNKRSSEDEDKEKD